MKVEIYFRTISGGIIRYAEYFSCVVYNLKISNENWLNFRKVYMST